MTFRKSYVISTVCLAVALAVQAQAPAQTQSGDLLIRNATVLTVSHGTLRNASVLIRGGKIAAVGANVEAPGGARVIDGTNDYVMPGIIDEHSHTAVDGGVNELAPSVSAMAHIKDVLNPEDINLYWQLAGGVTTIHVLHGSGNTIGGLDAVLKLKWGLPADQMLFPGAPQGIKFALGENPKRSNREPGESPRFPATRQGVADVLRIAFTHARQYMREWDAYNAAVQRGEHPTPPRRDVNLDSLVGVLRGQILVHCHSYVSDEILDLLHVADEFGFKIRSLEHGLEAYKVAPEVRAHDTGVSTFADFWQYKMEATDATAYAPALLTQKGVRVALNSDSDERARRLYQEAAKAIHYGGVSEDDALKMITLNPAWMLGIDQRVGSIDVGKDGDLAVFNGHPFAPASMVVYTVVDGIVYFDRAKDLASRKTPAEYERLFKPPSGFFGNAEDAGDEQTMREVAAQ